MGPGGFFPTNLDLADMLGRTDLDFDNVYVFDLLDPKFLDLSGSQISNILGFQAPAAPTPDELSDPNLTPLPTHPGIKYVARSPCCDNRIQTNITSKA